MRFWRWWKGPVRTSTAVMGLVSVGATIFLIAVLAAYTVADVCR